MALMQSFFESGQQKEPSGCEGPGCAWGEWLYQHGPELVSMAGRTEYQQAALAALVTGAVLLAWPIPAMVRQARNGLRRLLFLDPGESLLGYARQGSYDWLLNPLVRMLTSDRLTHCQVVAPTGQAKTSLLLSMIVQDLREGVGVFILEAGGDLAKKAIRYAEAMGRPVYLFDPGDETAMKWNPLAGDPEKVAEQVVSTLDSTGATGEPFFKEFSKMMVRHLVHTEAACAAAFGRTPTIDSLERYLLDDEWRDEQLGIYGERDDSREAKGQKRARKKDRNPKVSVRVPDLDEGARLFWEREFYGSWGDRERNQFTLGLRAQLKNLYGRRIVKAAISPEEGDEQFTIEEALESGALVCMRTSRGSGGESSNRNLSTWIIQRFQQETLDRGENAPPVMAYFDECHIYLGLANEEVASSASTWIAEVRKNNVGCVFAYQSLRQLPRALSDVLASGARHKLFSGGLTDDAREVQRYMGSEDTVVEDERHTEGSARRYVSRGKKVEEKPRYTEWEIREIPRGRWLYLGVRSGRVQYPVLLKACQAPSLFLVRAVYAAPRKGVRIAQELYEKAKARLHRVRQRRAA